MRYKVLILSFVFLALFGIHTVFAGFGITPPYVRNENLTRGSHYEQKIILVRQDPIEDLKGEITINVPDADSWISVDKGTEFILPKGEMQVPIVISVDVPKKAKYGDYKGSIRIRTSPMGNVEQGVVSIALGAQVDVNIRVVDKIFDFKIKRTKVFDLEEGHKWMWLYYPGKIKFSIFVENTGNIKAAPSMVRFEIYDNSGQNLLETAENTNNIEKIKPFDTKEVFAYLPTTLSAGSYLVKYSIFKKEEVAQKGEFNLSILPYGALQEHDGYGFLRLSFFHKLTLVLPVFIILLLAGYFAVRMYRRFKK